MKKTTILFLLLATAGFAQAQDLSSDAEAILDPLAHQYARYPSVSVEFTLRIEQGGGITRQEKGTVVVMGNMYAMTIPGQRVYCDGTTIWTYQQELDEISIFPCDEAEGMVLNPAQLLKDWKQNFKATFIREEAVGGKMLTLVDVTPVKQQSYYKIRIFVDEGKSSIAAFSLYEKDNTIYHYNFDKTVTSKILQKSDFQLIPGDYPGAGINDMR